MRAETRSGRLVSIALAAAALACATIGWSAVAYGLTIDIGGTVFADKCAPCHGNVAKTPDTFPVKFSHGNHITYACSSCHTQFPHRPEGTLKMDMKQCFNCHALVHGPQGVLATGKCYDCHYSTGKPLRPASHTEDWAETPHVQPARDELTTKCAMCHTLKQCDDCHIKTGVQWKPPVPFLYDAGTGCQACHGSPNLVRTTSTGVKSFQVTGLERSAHRDLSCQKCHPDFAYAEVKPATPLWNVNAGLACAECHDHDAQAKKYAESVHAKEIAKGNLRSATCGSCHRGHDIQRLDTKEASEALHASAESMCGTCHQDYWDSYSDYYHGAAYKRGAKDAPACWDCHDAHDVKAAGDPASPVDPANLPETCARCHQHKDSSESFVRASRDLIHKKVAVRQNNGLLRLVGSILGGRD
ncbi:MAG: hypothetical protein H5T75_07310 [Coriobacteriia bacterium]|nr:hypothetical protein [Coriobacteriia bacterium]